MNTICGLVGSLRKGSFNRGLMLTAMDVGRNFGLDIQIFERLDEVPTYNADYDTDPLRPASVNALKTAIGEAAGLIVATPEYNYSVPGGLKNAIDWASRPAGKSPLNRKPAAIMGASTGISGTIRAQLALRQSFVFTDTFALLQPEVLIPRCTERFDENGILTDQSTRDLIARQMQKFATWIGAVESMKQAGVT
ncbi:MAG: NAD(P)H-dependent oxidoreductase [Gemmatimonadota bacterium]|nr:NAD(P)H-dependent oxidoreductase [Gemmatimonadota bacterium]